MSFSFWGASIKAGKSHEFTPPEHSVFHVSGAALDSPHEAAPASLSVKTEGMSVTLANLDPQKSTSQQLDLVFPAGVLIEFSVKAAGKSSKKSKSSNSISISGYLQPSPFDYIEQSTPSKKRKRSQRGIDEVSSEPLEKQKKLKLADADINESNSDDDEDYDIEDLGSDDEEDTGDEFPAEMLDSEDEDDDEGNGPNLDDVLNLGDISSSSEEEDDEPVAVPEKPKKSKKGAKKDKTQKKAKKNNDVDAPSATPTPANPEESVEKAAEDGVEFPLSKSQKKKLKKQQKKQQKAAAKAAAATADEAKEDTAPSTPSSSENSKKKDVEKKSVPEKKKAATPVEQKKKLQLKEQNGVKYIDFQVGTGKPVKQGKRIKVLYVGSLAKNGKQFDKSLKYPFGFKLGKGEVIKGWDIGIQGMRVGGRRKLLIPAALGYGAQGAGASIPPHSDLRFTVEVVE